MPWFFVKNAIPSPHESLTIIAKGLWFTNADIAELLGDDPYNFPYEKATPGQVKKALKNKDRKHLLVRFYTGTPKGEKSAARRLRRKVLYVPFSRLKSGPYIPVLHFHKPSDVRY